MSCFWSKYFIAGTSTSQVWLAGHTLTCCDVLQEFMSFLKHADLCTHDFALELVGQEGGFHGKLAYSQQMFAESIGQRFTSSFEVSSSPLSIYFLPWSSSVSHHFFQPPTLAVPASKEHYTRSLAVCSRAGSQSGSAVLHIV